MFEFLFGLPESNCQPKGFWDLTAAIIFVFLGSKLFHIIKKIFFKYSCENKWTLFCHGSLFLFGLILLAVYPFFDRIFTWGNWSCQQRLPLLEIYFCLQASFYTHLLINETLKFQHSDHTFILHHIVTVALLFLSYMCNITRFASQITFIHNISDVFLFAMKIANNNGTPELIQSILDSIFKASWILTRLFLLPCIITPIAIIEISSLLNEDYWWPFYFSQQPYALRILFFLFISLLSLHIYWTVLVFCKGLKRVTN